MYLTAMSYILFLFQKCSFALSESAFISKMRVLNPLMRRSVVTYSMYRCFASKQENIMNVFDRKAKRKQKNRASMAEDYHVYEYLKEEVICLLARLVNDSLIYHIIWSLLTFLVIATPSRSRVGKILAPYLSNRLCLLFKCEFVWRHFNDNIACSFSG